MSDLETEFRKVCGKIKERLDEARELASEHGIPFDLGDDYFGTFELSDKWQTVDADVVEALTGIDWAESAGWDDSGCTDF